MIKSISDDTVPMSKRNSPLHQEGPISLEDIRSVPIPKHLFDSRGVIVGFSGPIIRHGVECVTLEFKKADDQSIVVALRYLKDSCLTWRTMLVFGCSFQYCAIVEETIRQLVYGVLNLHHLGFIPKNEYFLPVYKLVETFCTIEKELIRLHGDILVKASDIPITLNALQIAAETERHEITVKGEIEKHRIDSELKLKMHHLDMINKSN